MLYPSNKDFHAATTSFKKKYTKKNKKKEYINSDIQQIMKIYTTSWRYGKNAQKDCKLGVQSPFPRLCSHFIKSNLKIPKSCTHSFCIFAKAYNCCQQFRWIYQLNQLTPYLQFNLHQTITNIFPTQSLYQNHQIYKFTMKAIFDQIINETTSNNQFIIKINKKVTCALFLKRIGRDALAKAFDAKTDGFRVSYVPSDQKIAISVTQNIVMILSGGIIGTGYCNLVKSKSKKTKDLNDGQHAIIHILDEHLKDINIRFFVKNGFNGTIDAEIKSGEHVIKLTTFQPPLQPMDNEEDQYQPPPLPQMQPPITNSLIPFPPTLVTPPTSLMNEDNNFNVDHSFIFNDCESVYNINYPFHTLLSPDPVFDDIAAPLLNTHQNTKKRGRIDEDDISTIYINNTQQRKRQRFNNNFDCNQSMEFCQHS